MSNVECRASTTFVFFFPTFECRMSYVSCQHDIRFFEVLFFYCRMSNVVCRARHTTFDIRHSKVGNKILREWNNDLKADFYPSLPRVLRGALGPTSSCLTKKKSQWSGTLLYFVLRALNNGLTADFYSSLLRVLRGAQALVTGVEKNKNTMEWNTFIFFLTGVEQRPYLLQGSPAVRTCADSKVLFLSQSSTLHMAGEMCAGAEFAIRQSCR